MENTIRHQQVRALLFDLGGVVIEVDFMRTFRHWSERAGIPPDQVAGGFLPDPDYERHERGEISCATYFSRLADRLDIGLGPDAMVDGWNAMLVGEIPGIREVLARLAPVIPLYAFTNTNPTHRERWSRDHAGLVGHFRHVFVSSDMGLRKPEPAAYAAVVAGMEVEAGAVLFFDDNPQNVAGARAAGMQAVLVRHHGDVRAALAPWLGDVAG